MGKDKPNAVYQPGELARVRGKLGNIDESEAKRMAQILGGEVGTEKNAAPQPISKGHVSRNRRKTVEMTGGGRRRSRPGRAIDIAGDGDENYGFDSSGKVVAKKPHDPADDPAIALKTSYFERVKMDRYAAQFEFEIKNSLQVLTSIFSFVNEPVDYINARFVSRRINVYYSKIEQLVTSTRNLLPRHNARRTERLKKTSPFVFAVMEIIRYWNIERIGTDLSKVQSHPRSVRAAEFADILRSIYKPMFILEKLDMDIHIKGSYKLLYKLLLLEVPQEKEKHQDIIRVALSSFADIRREVHFGLYPLLMKLVSDRWFPYEKFFTERHRRYMAFLSTTEEEQIQPLALSPEQAESGNLEAAKEDIKKEGQEAEGEGESAVEEDPNDPAVVERKARQAQAEAERKAVRHSTNALEKLFPKAGWEKLEEYPDLFPYFANVYEMRHGYELISPTDPVQQLAVLMHIMENICVGLRSVSWGMAAGPDGKTVSVAEAIGEMVTNWRRNIDDSFMKEYLPRLSDYCRILEHSTESKNSTYARRTINELRWAKRLYFLPYYKFASIGPPPFNSQGMVTIYSQVRTLRKNLTLVATGIERGNRAGGAGAKAPCDGIENPWAHYRFELPNPVSKRLDALLPHEKRTNSILVFFALSTATILDNLINNENSWAYNDNSGPLFRSLNNEGSVPIFGVDEKLDADKIFKESLKRG